ncbi:hypothetical protein [Mycobacterium leprae]|nr:hypothetical protein [Mycobacterium leprae]
MLLSPEQLAYHSGCMVWELVVVFDVLVLAQHVGEVVFIDQCV